MTHVEYGESRGGGTISQPEQFLNIVLRIHEQEEDRKAYDRKSFEQVQEFFESGGKAR